VLGGLVLIAVVIDFCLFHNRETTDERRSMDTSRDSLQDLRPRCRVLVTDNQPVKAGQILVRIDPRDYQATGSSQSSRSTGRERCGFGGVDVPRTRENVASALQRGCAVSRAVAAWKAPKLLTTGAHL